MLNWIDFKGNKVGFRHFNQMPKAYLTYPSIIISAFKDKNIHLESFVLPNVCYEVAPCLVEPKHLIAYNDVCGFKNNGYIPAIYFAMRVQILHMYMMTQEDFPFSIMHLIHEKNQILQYQLLSANAAYKITCHFGEIYQTEQGEFIEFVSLVYMKGSIVAQAKSTYLKPRYENILKYACTDKQSIAQWRVTQRLIRRYAFISGDYNLIHLHNAGAKFWGLNQAIAHGMWSQACMIARLDLPAYYDFTESFDHPLNTGRHVALSLDHLDCELFDQETQQIYVSGQLKI